MSGAVPVETSPLATSLLGLVRRTSAELPADVEAAITAAARDELPGSRASYAGEVIQRNIELAAERGLPLCQDTGTLLFFVRHPLGYDTLLLGETIRRSVAEATRLGYLRQNSVDSLTGRNTGDNLGPGAPLLHYQAEARADLDIRLILKGGGCENVGAQYSLPDTTLQAGRDLEGVRRTLLDAVFRAQGRGCAPGVLGVCIGGDRASGYACSKEQFLRPLGEPSPVPELAALEARVLAEANSLGIGPMGFGGRTTLLGCQIGHLNRLPASFFVSVSYMCWAFRRQGVRLSTAGEVLQWLY